MLMAVDPGSDNYESMIEEIAEDGDARFIVVANIFCAAFILIISIVFMNYLLAASVEDIQVKKLMSTFHAFLIRLCLYFFLTYFFTYRLRKI